jgi:hypothetical protein
MKMGQTVIEKVRSVVEETFFFFVHVSVVV